ncbi:hypothetical protein [Halopiger aswanensis]|uniref:Uncharacterized protein n=1 Tax=Halopiger aswanensis TaxID=148449 RepID=A0A3R7I030_9EURY|nr:hypothetical protein [Halopiger aswanensis]RKD98118.1 hypothetical protein ATJ93_1122 [Halopiger aswanensis]
MLLESPIAVLGLLATVGVFGYVYRDATNVEMGRPLLWATVAAAPVLVGLGLYLFASVPTTGTIMTANTGAVIYTFEREVMLEDDDPPEPGELPHQK